MRSRRGLRLQRGLSQLDGQNELLVPKVRGSESGTSHGSHLRQRGPRCWETGRVPTKQAPTSRGIHTQEGVTGATRDAGARANHTVRQFANLTLSLRESPHRQRGVDKDEARKGKIGPTAARPNRSKKKGLALQQSQVESAPWKLAPAPWKMTTLHHTNGEFREILH